MVSPLPQRVVVNVDNDRYARQWIRSALNDNHPDIRVDDTDFAGAGERVDWSDVQYVVVDLCEQHPDASSDEYPACDVIRSTRAKCRQHRPIFVVVSGATIGPRSPVVQHRLLDAGADFLIARHEFAAVTAQVFGVEGPTYQRLESLSRAVPDLGIPHRARLQDFVDNAKAVGYLRRRFTGGTATRVRKKLGEAGNISPRSIAKRDGGLPLVSAGQDRVPSDRQLREILRQATRETPDH